MGDSKNHVYDDVRFDSKNIGQFERNPRLETTTRARLNLNNVDERTRIVQQPTSEISQTIHCWLHVCTWSWVGPDSGKNFGWAGRGKVSAIAVVILLDLLHGLVGLDRYVEKKGPSTHRSKWVCLGWDRFGKPMHVHIWDLRDLWILQYVSR
jgi:hypothetical protein